MTVPTTQHGPIVLSEQEVGILTAFSTGHCDRIGRDLYKHEWSHTAMRSDVRTILQYGESLKDWNDRIGQGGFDSEKEGYLKFKSALRATASKLLDTRYMVKGAGALHYNAMAKLLLFIAKDSIQSAPK